MPLTLLRVYLCVAKKECRQQRWANIAALTPECVVFSMNTLTELDPASVTSWQTQEAGPAAAQGWASVGDTGIENVLA